MEHCQDFLGTLLVHAGKLRPGGRLYYAIPNRLFTFDRDRPNTTIEHLVLDHEQGPSLSKRDHYLEWVHLVAKTPAHKAGAYAQSLMDAAYSIHFHAWDARALLHCLTAGIEYLRFPGSVVHFEMNGHEVICLIEKE
ncbi:MAG: hypothetical protein H6935_03560 [Thiobacillus sp.]|nr:hypothetical protein [Thiobacillus sp.]